MLSWACGKSPWNSVFFSKTFCFLRNRLLWTDPCLSPLILGLLSCSVQFSRSVLSNSLWPHESQHARPPCPSPTPGVHWDSHPSSQWCHPASGSSQMSQLFTSGGQSIGVSASASVLPMNTQDWSPLGWNSWISLQSKGLSRVFSNTTVQKHQFYVQLSL